MAHAARRTAGRRRAARSTLVATAALGVSTLSLPMLASSPATAGTTGAPPVLGQVTTPAAAGAAGGQCVGEKWVDRVRVPGAEQQKAACLADLTTVGTTATGHTVPADWAGLTSTRTTPPTRKVPGIQVDGYFPDRTPGDGYTPNANNGWNHDAQFVLRLPDRWNGKLIVSGAPGVRRQYANDAAISDDALARGYAFAATDKGNTGATFYKDGRRPGDAVAEWNRRVTQLTRAAQRVVKQRYGRRAERTYMAGLSNGGYLVRWQLENRPQLYDGGVDWEGTLFRAEGPNLLTYLPTALREYPRYLAGDASARDRMLAAGFSPGSEFLWDFHYRVYWDLTQRIYREEFDPAYDGDIEAGTPFCKSGTPGCDADYDYFSRPASVRRAVERVQLTGRIRRPMLTLHGTLDTLLPRETDSDVYRRLIRRAGRADLHRYYVIEAGNHVDGLVDAFPTQLRPILPCFRDGLSELEGWVERGERPARSGLVPATSGAPDTVNRCSLADARR